jgi:hypothetical protein
MFFGIYILILKNYPDAAVCAVKLFEVYCSLSILPYVVGAWEITFDVSDYSAV